jgi:hypothetical protein
MVYKRSSCVRAFKVSGGLPPHMLRPNLLGIVTGIHTDSRPSISTRIRSWSSHSLACITLPVVSLFPPTVPKVFLSYELSVSLFMLIFV